MLTQAGSDGELIIKKNEPSEIKDCFETFNRATLLLIQGLDKIILNQLQVFIENCPSPLKSGVSNSLNNLSILLQFLTIFYKVILH